MRGFWITFTSPPVETKPDIYALPTFVAWAEKQPAEQKYNFMNCHGGCLIGRYLADHGLDMVTLQANGHSLYTNFSNATGWDQIAFQSPRTFGAAAARAGALLP